MTIVLKMFRSISDGEYLMESAFYTQVKRREKQYLKMNLFFEIVNVTDSN